MGAPALSEGEVRSGRASLEIFGSWSLAAGEGQVPGVPCHRPRPGLQQSPAGMAVPCSLLMPAVTPKVSSVLEGSVLFLALNQGLSRRSQGGMRFFLGNLLLCSRARAPGWIRVVSSQHPHPGALGDLLSCGPGWEEADRGCWGGTGDGVVPEQRGPCREKWCHMTQEERDDSLRFNENITFGQLG